MAKKILCIFIGSANDLVNSAYISCFFKVENSFSYALYQSPSKTLISSQASYKSNLDLKVWAKQNKIMTLEVQNYKTEYRKVASSNTSRFEAHAGLFRLLMKGIFDAYVL